jgi:ribonuclease BN (tRNA processing enzyme)
VSDALSLTILGGSGAWPNPGQAASGVLVQGSGARLLLDCGTGVLAALLELDPRPLDAVVLSHLHFDHTADLIPFAYARTLGPLGGWPAPRLLAPPGGRQGLRDLCAGAGTAPDHLEGPFAVDEYDAREPVVVGGLHLRFAEVRHPGGSRAIRVEAGGRSLCFSGDTGWTPALPTLARDVGVLLCECGMGDGPGGSPVHLTGSEAGRAAAEARAGALVVTHVPADARDGVLAQARAAFSGPVALATPGLRLLA